MASGPVYFASALSAATPGADVAVITFTGVPQGLYRMRVSALNAGTADLTQGANLNVRVGPGAVGSAGNQIQGQGGTIGSGRISTVGFPQPLEIPVMVGPPSAGVNQFVYVATVAAAGAGAMYAVTASLERAQ